MRESQPPGPAKTRFLLRPRLQVSRAWPHDSVAAASRRRETRGPSEKRRGHLCSREACHRNAAHFTRNLRRVPERTGNLGLSCSVSDLQAWLPRSFPVKLPLVRSVLLSAPRETARLSVFSQNETAISVKFGVSVSETQAAPVPLARVMAPELVRRALCALEVQENAGARADGAAFSCPRRPNRGRMTRA